MSLLARLADELGMPPDALRAALSEGGESESLTPTYLTTNPDGTTSASFTGKIHAQGLDLDCSNLATPPNVDQIRWIDQGNGKVVAEITASDALGAGPENLFLGAYGGLAYQSNTSAVIAQAQSVDDGSSATLEVIAQGNASLIQGNATPSGGGLGVTKTFLKGDGSSDFLQLAATANRKLAFGQANATFPGGSPSANDTTVSPTGFGSITPLAVVANCILVFEADMICQVLGVALGSFKVRVRTVDGSSPAAGLTKAFYWIAIG